MNLKQIGCVWLALVLACASAVSVAANSKPPTLIQKRPFFHDWTPPNVPHFHDYDIDVDRDWPRGKFGRKLEKFGVLEPLNDIMLDVDVPADCPDEESVTTWKFSKDSYLPPEVRVAGDKTIQVIAWQSFPVEATVECNGKITTYSRWIEVIKFGAQTQSTEG
jgi:hypothetical protein